MSASLALSIKKLRKRFPGSLFKGSANLLVMPNLDAANISFNMARHLADGIAIGPILVGTAESVHIVTANTTVRGYLI